MPRTVWAHLRRRHLRVAASQGQPPSSLRGLTLTELLITVVVIAVLAAIALPGYQRAVERSRWQAAQDVLLTIHAGEQVLRSQTGEYAAHAATDSDWNDIFMDNPNVGTPIPEVVFSVTVDTKITPSGTEPTFTGQADRGGGRIMTITSEDRNIDTTAWPKP